LLSNYNTKVAPATVKNQIYQVHLTMGDMLQTMTFTGEERLTELQ
jgi:hypothetical protein